MTSIIDNTLKSGFTSLDMIAGADCPCLLIRSDSIDAEVDLPFPCCRDRLRRITIKATSRIRIPTEATIATGTITDEELLVLLLIIIVECDVDGDDVGDCVGDTVGDTVGSDDVGE